MKNYHQFKLVPFNLSRNTATFWIKYLKNLSHEQNTLATNLGIGVTIEVVQDVGLYKLKWRMKTTNETTYVAYMRSQPWFLQVH